MNCVKRVGMAVLLRYGVGFTLKYLKSLIVDNEVKDFEPIDFRSEGGGIC